MTPHSLAELRCLLKETPSAALAPLIERLEADERHGAHELAGQARRRLLREQNERDRVSRLLRYETDLWSSGMMLVAGCDEAGRGALAGPIAAAAVILDPDIFISGINDSKKLSRAARARTATAIEANAICWSVAFISSADIDETGIQAANRAAMVEAVHKLVLAPDFLLSDGFKVEAGVRNRALIKGDSISLTIAAASIIAKVHRDRLMEELEEQYPGYGLAEHKGYGTELHMDSLTRLGPSPIHRLTFAPVGLSRKEHFERAGLKKAEGAVKQD